jgi:hypothetical protein
MTQDAPLQSPPVAPVAATLEAARELEWLVKSIEEASKHGREVLLVLLATSFYVLLAVFASRANDSVQLPLLSISVSNNVFLWVGPVLVLAPYLYLQVCVRDLMQRLRIFEAFPLDLRYAKERTMLLYPFLLTLGLSKKTQRVGPQGGTESVQLTVAYDLPLFIATVSVVWCLAPFILLSLWTTFIGRQQSESLVPCFALIAVIYGTFLSGKRTRIGIVIKATLAVILLAVSLISIPALRHSHALEAAWHTAQTFGVFLGDYAIPVLLAAAAVATLSLTLGSAVSGISLTDNEQFRNGLELRWIVASEGKGIWNAISARILWVLLRLNVSLRQVVVTFFILAVSTGIAFAWFTRNVPSAAGSGPGILPPPPCQSYPNCASPPR